MKELNIPCTLKWKSDILNNKAMIDSFLSFHDSKTRHLITPKIMVAWRKILRDCKSYKEDIIKWFHMFLEEKKLTDDFWFVFNSIEAQRWRTQHGYKLEFNKLIETTEPPYNILSYVWDWECHDFSMLDKTNNRLIQKTIDINCYALDMEFFRFIRERLYGKS
jgi:hypothetical protein